MASVDESFPVTATTTAAVAVAVATTTATTSVIDPVLVWCGYDGSGGLGDRLMGMVTCWLLAQRTARRFLIDWLSPDMSAAFSVRQRYCWRRAIADDPTLVVAGDAARGALLECWMDDHGRVVRPHELVSRRRDARVVRVVANQSLHHHAYGDEREYGDATFDAFRRVWLDLLAPSEDAVTRAQARDDALARVFSGDARRSASTLGVHVRLGDWTFATAADDVAEFETMASLRMRALARLVRDQVVTPMLTPRDGQQQAHTADDDDDDESTETRIVVALYSDGRRASSTRRCARCPTPSRRACAARR